MHVLVRSDGLAATMSDYLVQRIERSPDITLHARTEVISVEGKNYLEQVTWKNRKTGDECRLPIGSLFVMIGADPNTQWLQGCVPFDDKGFVVTGNLPDGAILPSPYATALNGVFTIGDVRSRSVKRVASAVGEGSVVISSVHQYLAGLN